MLILALVLEDSGFWKNFQFRALLGGSGASCVHGGYMNAAVSPVASVATQVPQHKTVEVRGQNYLSDTFFTLKMDTLKHTILNTAYIETLEIFPLARKSLPIHSSTSRSTRNQSCFQCW